MSQDLQQRIRALRTAERSIRPDDAWVLATRETLMMQVRNSLPTQTVHLVARVREAFRHFVPPSLTRVFRGPIAAALSMAVVVLGGSVASVSAAERSLPGDFLYSLKLVTEQARLAFTPSTDEKLKLKVEFTARRVDDLKTVAHTTDTGSVKKDRIVQAAEILKRDLNTLKQQLDDVKTAAVPEKTAEAAKLVDQRTSQLVQTLQEAKNDLSLETKEKVTEAQAAAADASVKAIEVLVETNQVSSSTVSTSDVVQAIQDHAKIVADATPAASASVVTTTVSIGVGPAASTTITIVASSGTPALTTTSTVELTEAVAQMKIVTQNAFVAQKTLEQTEAAASSSMPVEGTISTSSTQATTSSSTADVVGSSASSTTAASGSASSSTTQNDSLSSQSPP